MPETTLQEILAKLRAALEELQEYLKRQLARGALALLKQHDETEDFTPAIWSPPQTNDDTTDADIDALSIADLDTWLAQNKDEVEQLMEPL